jgi:chromosome segregation ATPase
MSAPTDGAAELAALRDENAELRRRVVAADAAIAELRAEALGRRAEVRALAEALPTAVSRRAVLRAMLRDVRHHPDPLGVATRGIRKLGRAPGKLARIVMGRR